MKKNVEHFHIFLSIFLRFFFPSVPCIIAILWKPLFWIGSYHTNATKLWYEWVNFLPLSYEVSPKQMKISFQFSFFHACVFFSLLLCAFSVFKYNKKKLHRNTAKKKVIEMQLRWEIKLKKKKNYKSPLNITQRA